MVLKHRIRSARNYLGIEKFKNYVYGSKIMLVTDHKPLTPIKTSPKNSKILRWRLELEAFDYDIQYRECKPTL